MGTLLAVYLPRLQKLHRPTRTQKTDAANVDLRQSWVGFTQEPGSQVGATELKELAPFTPKLGMYFCGKRINSAARYIFLLIFITL
jgi:hypothetical protein